MHASSSLPRLLAPWVLAVALLLCSGCGSSSSTTSSTDRSDVLGVWEYQTNGSRLLSEGFFRIVFQQGRLQGQLRDTRLGRVPLRDVRIQNGRLNLRIEYRSAYSSETGYLEVNGHVRNDELTATYYLPMRDVSTSPNIWRSSSASTPNGSLYARRVQGGTVDGFGDPLDCTSPLVESNYRCD